MSEKRVGGHVIRNGRWVPVDLVAEEPKPKVAKKPAAKKATAKKPAAKKGDGGAAE